VAVEALQGVLTATQADVAAAQAEIDVAQAGAERANNRLDNHFGVEP
jgi:outer membrane murein-binding lipoprotein Lpp